MDVMLGSCSCLGKQIRTGWFRDGCLIAWCGAPGRSTGDLTYENGYWGVFVSKKSCVSLSLFLWTMNWWYKWISFIWTVSFNILLNWGFTFSSLYTSLVHGVFTFFYYNKMLYCSDFQWKIKWKILISMTRHLNSSLF